MILRFGLTAILGCTACSGPPEIERDLVPLMQTSELRYRWERHDIGFSVAIPYTYRNETGGPVLLLNCRGDVRPLLQVRREGRWVDAWRPFQTSCDTSPVTIRAGAQFVDTLRVVGAPPGSNVKPAFVFEEMEGVYRLLWFQAKTTDLEAADLNGTELRNLDTDLRVSNPFVLSFR